MCNQLAQFLNPKQFHSIQDQDVTATWGSVKYNPTLKRAKLKIHSIFNIQVKSKFFLALTLKQFHFLVIALLILSAYKILNEISFGVMALISPVILVPLGTGYKKQFSPESVW
ncbi:hypothetical protein RF11_13112 [Thelohanellus kitauei]|uniref:Uncharacterized protein n=1 Tax=Thelohanellus kitauei TaxID=669202 RepID=A0A0C2NA52_THEKT|nr:hypothetical protein RF11_13112 [Thelohanellus kitauei]